MTTKIPPKAAAALRRALSLNWADSALDPQLCLASFVRGAGRASVQQVQITAGLGRTLKGALGETLGAKRSNEEAGSLDLKPYAPLAHLEPQDVEVLDLASFPGIDAEVRRLLTPAALPEFQGEAEFVKGLRYSAIVLDEGGEAPVCIFRTMSAKRELQRSRWLGIVLEHGAFAELTDEVYLLDLGIDCLSCDGYLFIFQKGNFQTIFRFFEEIKKKAREVLEVLRERDLIDGFQDFEKACLGQVQMAAKLHNAATAEYFPFLTVAKLKAVAKQFNREVRFAKSGGRERAVFDPANKWELLRLLDDDLLASPLTRRRYEVNSKREV